MPDQTTIAVDAMGGDLGHRAVVDGALAAIHKNPALSVLLVGPVDELESSLAACDTYVPADHHDRVELVASSQVVTMDDNVAHAVRHKKDSSMRVAINLVKQGKAAACVSCGNTGALVATSKFVLKTISGIKRPAILSPIPSEQGATIVLDLGANSVCTADNLCEFAVMGSVVADIDFAIKNPRVGLLNIGTELGKGLEIINQAHVRLTQSTSLNYIGFVEGGDIFGSAVDVVVCDGFAGNVALKTIEGFAAFVARRIAPLLTKSASTKALDSATSSDLIKASMFDPRVHNGARLVGLNGVVIKSHGRSDATAIRYAIETAFNEANSQIPRHMAAALEKFEQTIS